MAKRLYSDFMAESSGVASVASATASVARNLVGASVSEVQKIHDSQFRKGEMIERKRLPPAIYRLHSAKWLQMDKMLKHLLFPLQRVKLNFGFSSYSGIDQRNAEDLLDIPKSAVSDQRCGGQYRGIAFFDLRNTDTTSSVSSANALNADPQVVGAVSATTANSNFSVDSIYRSFHNGPGLLSTNTSGIYTGAYDGNVVTQTAMQSFSSAPATAQNEGTTVRGLSMGVNLSQIESASLNSMCYADPIVSSGRLITAGTPGNAGVAAQVVNVNNTETTTNQSGITTSGNSLYQSSGNYNYQVRNGIVRIADGCVTMDILNTENTPCMVEIVILSKKKNNRTKQNIFDQFYSDAQMYYASKGVTGGTTTGINDANDSGGWQTFYDPDVPLLKLPASSTVYDLVTEVHRSNHILAPGQSKLVKIQLGNLWYKLINKNDSTIIGSSPLNGFTSEVDNVGTLFCAVGHSGFLAAQGIQTLTDGTSNTNIATLPSNFNTKVFGSGWWVGATHTQSSILVSGGYEEKFYPMTFDRSVVEHTQHNIHRPAFLEAQSNPNAWERASVPTVQIIPEKVVTADSTFRDTTFRSEL